MKEFNPLEFTDDDLRERWYYGMRGYGIDVSLKQAGIAAAKTVYEEIFDATDDESVLRIVRNQLAELSGFRPGKD